MKIPRQRHAARTRRRQSWPALPLIPGVLHPFSDVDINIPVLNICAKPGGRQLAGYRDLDMLKISGIYDPDRNPPDTGLPQRAHGVARGVGRPVAEQEDIVGKGGCRWRLDTSGRACAACGTSDR